MSLHHKQQLKWEELKKLEPYTRMVFYKGTKPYNAGINYTKRMIRFENGRLRSLSYLPMRTGGIELFYGCRSNLDYLHEKLKKLKSKLPFERVS